MNNLPLTNKRKAALLTTLDNAIDMYNDTATDPMWMRPEEIRELAASLDDEGLSRIVSANSRAVMDNIELLVELEILRNELQSIN